MQIMKPTDIVVTTYNRLDCLKRTLAYIFERTHSPYRLHVIDDGSTEGNQDYLFGLLKEGKLFSLVLRGENVGAMPNLNVGAWLSFSDPVVFTDDDILCPDIEPDWLAQGLDVMKHHKHLGILALNNPCGNPHNKRRKTSTKDRVTYCGYLGHTFMFVSRKCLMDCPLSHRLRSRSQVPATNRLRCTREKGYEIAYITDVFCQHIGEWSMLRNRKFGPKMDVTDEKTLEPPEKWRW